VIMSLLSMKSVKKSFDDVEILKDISLEVGEGEILSIIGPSGSGKSTLLRCATLLESMDDGELSYSGNSVCKSVAGKSVYESPATLKKISECFGLVFQNFNLFPHMNVLQNICDAPIRVQKRDKASVKKEAFELLKKRGLSDRADAYPYQLSGGQYGQPCLAHGHCDHYPIG